MATEAVQHLETLEHYEQDSGANITYQFLVKPGTMGLLSAGRICMQGPTTKADDVHAEWDQVYLVLSGSGTVLVGDSDYPIGPGSVVRIPKGTRHGVALKENERIEYCYFNAFVDADAVKRLSDTL